MTVTETESSPPRIRCLVVEDEALVAMGLKFGLEGAGFEVVGPATHLEAAVEMATQAEVDVAILDVALHGADVFPAADILVARSIPFVFHTGHGDRLDLDERYPFAPVCVKPTDSKTLARTVRSVLVG